jgi:glycosyltransferase involved in cell wall biosynthesis
MRVSEAGDVVPGVALSGVAENGWQLPAFDVVFAAPRSRRHCLVVPVFNEGSRLHRTLEKIQALPHGGGVDTVVVDGGSSDGSVSRESLHGRGVHTLLVKRGPGRLSAQLRCAYAHALRAGYEGVITIDGNDKDDPAAIPAFLAALGDGTDFVQASRFVAGGEAVNTPLVRELAIRWLHAPLLSIASGHRWTDTTQGFRAYSRRLLLDPRVAPFRDVFVAYELLAYLNYRAPRLGFRCVELPTARRYPADGQVPTKIGGLRGNLALLATLFRTVCGGFDPATTHARHRGSEQAGQQPASD